MKRKRKKEEKKRKEAKRKRYRPASNSRPSMYRTTALPLGHVEHTRSKRGIFITKTFRALLNMSSKNCSLDSENPT